MCCSGSKVPDFYFVAIVLQMVLKNPGIFVTAYKDRLTSKKNSNSLTILSLGVKEIGFFNRIWLNLVVAILSDLIFLLMAAQPGLFRQLYYIAYL